MVAGIKAFKNKGNASIAKELDNNKVANNKCFYSIIGRIFFAYKIYSSVPPFKTNSKCKKSIELYPTVNPDINPANITIQNA